jgi:hypothetical protein
MKYQRDEVELVLYRQHYGLTQIWKWYGEYKITSVFHCKYCPAVI